MKFLILGLLMREPLSLYALHGRFAAGLSHIYAASYGSIHRALRQLHEAGHVELVDGGSRNQKQYMATSQGRQTWLEWMKQPQATEDSEASMLARVFLLGLLERYQDQREVLRALHERAVRDLGELRAVDAAMSPSAQRYPRAALDYGLRTSQGAVAWLEELLGELGAIETRLR